MGLLIEFALVGMVCVLGVVGFSCALCFSWLDFWLGFGLGFIEGWWCSYFVVLVC